MNKTIIWTSLILGLVILVGCTTIPQQIVTPKQPIVNVTNTTILVGNDTDSHGCILSAGFSWCAVKDRCIKPFEENCTTPIVINTTSFASKEYTLQNKVLTPGAISTGVDQDNINITICKAGYTTSIRPSSSWTNPRKITSMQEYGLNISLTSKYEYDHLIPLELGGCPDCTTNLWPEPYPSATIKDTLENKLHKKVCDGSMTLREAQSCIVSDWVKCAQANEVVFPRVI